MNGGRLLRGAAIVAVALFLASCNRDHSITRGANGHNDWERRLKVAVPLGVPISTAQATMERNGFACHRDALGTQTLRCEKQSGRKFGFFRRRWQAIVSVRDGHVSDIRGTSSFGHRP